MDELMKTLEELTAEIERIYYIGISKGASVVAREAFRYRELLQLVYNQRLDVIETKGCGHRLDTDYPVGVV